MWGTPQWSRRISTCFCTPGTLTFSPAVSAPSSAVQQRKTPSLRSDAALINTPVLLRRTNQTGFDVELICRATVARPGLEVEAAALRDTIHRNAAECKRRPGLADLRRAVGANEVDHAFAFHLELAARFDQRGRPFIDGDGPR